MKVETMVNSIEGSPRGPALSRVQTGGPTEAAGAVVPAAAGSLPEPVQSGLARARAALAASPPVDNARVEALRAAIAAGTYAVDPQAIVDAMIAHELGSPAAG